jgi:DNA-binding XRE family transcriptional regulator
VFIQNPADSEQKRSVDGDAARLIYMGVHVNLRKLIHEKLAVIDENIFWDGSLNILSQRNSRERMTRWVDRSTAFRAIVAHELNQCAACAQQRRSASAMPRTDNESLQIKLIGSLLRNRRKLLGLSQKDLAAATGLSQSTVSDIESGDRSIGAMNLLKLCSRLDLTLRPIPWYVLPTIDDLFSSLEK